MENETKFQEINYFFEDIMDKGYCRDFFRLNCKLMEGFHIEHRDSLLLSLMKDYYNVMYIYYDTFYDLALKKENKVDDSYFYLSINN